MMSNEKRAFLTVLLAAAVALALSGTFNAIAFSFPVIGSALWQASYLLPAWMESVIKLVQAGFFVWLASRLWSK